jgi:hypothetical protein
VSDYSSSEMRPNGNIISVVWRPSLPRPTHALCAARLVCTDSTARARGRQVDGVLSGAAHDDDDNNGGGAGGPGNRVKDWHLEQASASFGVRRRRRRRRRRPRVTAGCAEDGSAHLVLPQSVGQS